MLQVGKYREWNVGIVDWCKASLQEQEDLRYAA